MKIHPFAHAGKWSGVPGQSERICGVCNKSERDHVPFCVACGKPHGATNEWIRCLSEAVNMYRIRMNDALNQLDQIAKLRASVATLPPSWNEKNAKEKK